MVKGVVWGPDYDASGNVEVVDGEATGEDFAGKDAADGWGETHGFVDDCAEIDAGVQGWAGMDLLLLCERSPDLLGQLLQGGGIMHQVEERARQCRRCSVRACNNEKVTLAPEFWTGEAFSCLGISSVEKVVEEVFAIGFESDFAAFGGLGLTVCHILHAHVVNSAEEYFVEAEGFDHWVGAELLSLVDYRLWNSCAYD